jgi:hypothetical protein
VTHQKLLASLLEKLRERDKKKANKENDVEED